MVEGVISDLGAYVSVCSSVRVLVNYMCRQIMLIFHSFVKTLSTYKQVNNYFYILVHKVGGGGGGGGQLIGKIDL